MKVPNISKYAPRQLIMTETFSYIVPLYHWKYQNSCISWL